jgi:hypothetical protein
LAPDPGPWAQPVRVRCDLAVVLSSLT